MEDLLNELSKQISDDKQKYYMVPIESSNLVFEERVKFNCFYCGKYNNCWKCPPKIPDINFRKMFSEYNNSAFVYGRFGFDDTNYQTVRNESSVLLHKALLKLEKLLWNENNSTAISFIGGSCKLCKNGCGKEKCNNPYLARSPIEATGINVILSAKKYGIDIDFPPKDFIIRIGLILW